MYWLQHRINFIASFLLTYENPRGFSWFVFYLINSLLLKPQLSLHNHVTTKLETNERN